MDKCISILLKLARNKEFERLVKLKKGKTSERISQIQLRHRTSLKMLSGQGNKGVPNVESGSF